MSALLCLTMAGTALAVVKAGVARPLEIRVIEIESVKGREAVKAGFDVMVKDPSTIKVNSEALLKNKDAMETLAKMDLTTADQIAKEAYLMAKNPTYRSLIEDILTMKASDLKTKGLFLASMSQIVKAQTEGVITETFNPSSVDGRNLTAAEVDLLGTQSVREEGVTGIKKLLTVTEQGFEKWDPANRELFTRVAQIASKNVFKNSKVSMLPEVALILAIKEAKGCTMEEAIKAMRQMIKDC